MRRIALIALFGSSLVGCGSTQTAPPRLPPRALEEFRSAAARAGDPALSAELSRALDAVQVEWPRRPMPSADAEPPRSLANLRDAVRRVPDEQLRARLNEQVDVLAAAWRSGPEADADWFLHPDRVRVDSTFTQFVTAEDSPPFLDARLQLVDADGQSTRALGKFRIELYEAERRASDPRGRRLAWWNVDVQSRADNLRYFDPLIRGYKLQLSMDSVPAAGPATRYVLEATFIRTDGVRVPPVSYHYLDAVREVRAERGGGAAGPLGILQGGTGNEE